MLDLNTSSSATAPCDLNTSGSETAVENLNTSDSSPRWGGSRPGAGRPKDPASIRSDAAARNQQLTRKRKPVSKTRIWEARQIGKVHPILIRMLSGLPPGRGQRKYRWHKKFMIPNSGPSKNMLLQLARLTYRQQFNAVAIMLFDGELPDEFKELFESDDETLIFLAIETNPEMKRQANEVVKQ
jgi:hypothetical protein